MALDKDGINNLAWELRMREENQATHEAELIMSSKRDLQEILADSFIEFDDSVFENIEEFGPRELVRQVTPTKGVYKRPHKYWGGGGWDVYQEKNWRLEVMDTNDPIEPAEPEYSIVVRPAGKLSDFEPGSMPRFFVIDVVFDGLQYPVGGHIHSDVYSEPRVQRYLDDMIDLLS